MLAQLRRGGRAASRFPVYNNRTSATTRNLTQGPTSRMSVAAAAAAAAARDPPRLKVASAVPRRRDSCWETRSFFLPRSAPSRLLSSTARQLTREDEEAKKKNKEKDNDSDDRADSSSSTTTTKQPLKGIRKVLPSLTPRENIYTVPNILTFSRLAVAPFIGYAIVHDAHTLALGLFAYAGVSDLLDGWIARRWKLQTVVGSVVDPMADKILMTVLTVSLAMQGALPVWLAVIILGRDAGLGMAAIYYRWISLPPPKTFTRYWDFSLPSAEVRPTTISKYNTFLQLGLMGATMVAPVVTVDVSAAMTALQYLVATTTVWSGLSYVFSKDAVRILSSADNSNNKGKHKKQQQGKEDEKEKEKEQREDS